jgi:hypothetical protein
VIGTPTVQVGSNALAPYFSNLHVVIDGITVLAPQDPSLVGVDLRGAAQASVLDLATMINAGPAAINPFTGGHVGSNGLGVGLMMPAPGNNAVCDIGVYSCEGWNCAITLAEHVVAQRILALYCDTAIFVALAQHGIATNHASAIDYLCAEGVNKVIDATTGASNQAFALDIAACDTEISDTGTHILDANSNLRGEIRWHDYQATAPRVSGARHVRIINTASKRGNVAAPALPATTVELVNPFWRDAAVAIAGGTVTAILVDGVATGLTSGTVIVPAGKGITVNYSVAPTWKWTLL